MKTPLEKLIEVVEKGYNDNKVLWEEWKTTLLEEEQDMVKTAFLCGDDSVFHFGIKDITNLKEFWDYYRLLK